MNFSTDIKTRIAVISFAGMVLLSEALYAQEASSLSAGARKLEKSLIQNGRFYFNAKKYDAAIQQWNTALSLDPQNKELERYIADAKIKLKEAPPPKQKDIITRSIPAKPLSVPTKPTTTPHIPDIHAKPSRQMLAPKEITGPLSVDACIAITAKNYLPLRIAERNVKLAQMRVWEARRNLLPTVGIRFEEYSGRIGRAYIGRRQFVEGQQPIFHGGELYFTAKQAEVNLEITRNDCARIKNDIALQVKKNYYTLLKAQENLRMQYALSAEVDKMFEMVNKQYEFGLLAKIDLLNVTSQASQVKFQLASSKGDTDVAELILKQTMNLDPKEKIEIVPDLRFTKTPVDYQALLRLAMMNRPEMKINALMIGYYQYETRVVRAKRYPKLDFMYNWGLAKEEFASPDREGPNNPGSANPVYDMDQKLQQQWYAGFKASVPFWGSTGEYAWTKEQWVPTVSSFQGTEAVTSSYKVNILDNLKMYSDKESADIDMDRARQEQQKAEQDIVLEVREACFSYEKALLLLETATTKVAFQEKDLEITRLRREFDEVQDSGVIDGMIKLTQEKFGYYGALTDLCTSQASIEKAIAVENYFKVPDAAINPGAAGDASPRKAKDELNS